MKLDSLQDTRNGDLTIFAPVIEPSMVVWHGALPSNDDIAERYGAQACLPSMTLSSTLVLICVLKHRGYSRCFPQEPTVLNHNHTYNISMHMPEAHSPREIIDTPHHYCSFTYKPAPRQEQI